MKNLIIIGRNLTKSYDGIHNILSDVNIEIEAGSKNLIIGESGCGKTPLLSILEGIEQPDSGVLILKDCDMYGMKLQQWLKEWIQYSKSKTKNLKGQTIMLKITTKIMERQKVSNIILKRWQT